MRANETEQVPERVTMATAPKIFTAINEVMRKVGAIGKAKRNQQQGFAYRGVDDVMNALAPILQEEGIFIVPRVLSHKREERQTRNGGALLYSICECEFTFYATDGSCVKAVTIGEGMDSSDKATNKAMSIAFKYACFQVFCIPTEEMRDPDAEVHDVAPQVYQAQVTQPQISEAEMLRMALADVEKCNTEAELRDVWNKYAQLKAYPAFSTPVSARRKKIAELNAQQ